MGEAHCTAASTTGAKVNKPVYLHAYCYRGGQIEFGANVPDGALPLGKSRNAKKLREVVEVNARRAYDGITLLVPGIPEADGDEAAHDARRYFCEIVELRLANKSGWPTPRIGGAA